MRLHERQNNFPKALYLWLCAFAFLAFFAGDNSGLRLIQVKDAASRGREALSMMTAIQLNRLLVDLRKPSIAVRVAAEPYRVFFPLATLAGLTGVALWPLHLGAWLETYPGTAHARLMVHGFFFGFILGFLGTALPRVVGARPLSPGWLVLWLGAYVTMVASLVTGHVLAGDVGFLSLIGLLLAFAATRFRMRTDLPPPGFALVGIGLSCGIAGGFIGVASGLREIDPFWIMLQRLLSYQGLVLLPVLGVGGFLLPRFFGLPNRQDLPESRTVTRAWLGSAAVALSVGGLIVASFVVEALGHGRVAHAVRGLVAAAYLVRQVPFHRSKIPKNAVSWVLRAGFAAAWLGLLTIAVFPEWRVALLHTTLVGGLAVITFVVATRVIFGHSGNLRLLSLRNRWLWIAWGLMIFGMLSRIVGDFLPRIMASHYNYGAACWIAGVLLWAAYVLPKVCVFEEED